uniref:Uncharacterized protein n=1 Tax=Oryza rufipogon TaxID=4529 RepID=A0A0E0R8I1_ORYRU
MGIDPSFGIGCLGKVNVMYEDDMELMVKFYQFVAKELMSWWITITATEDLRKQLESANFDTDASILTPEQIQEIVEN